MTTRDSNLWQALLAGGFAGTAVDVSLFPLDTLKTRLQAPDGFWRTGGFKGVYRGLSSAVAGSAPSASLFFVTYEFLKQHNNRLFSIPTGSPVGHMLAASVGEMAACMVRVPTEVLKQRFQAGQYGGSLSLAVQTVFRESGVLGFYRGFAITVFREIPFSCIQFPLFEYFKHVYRIRTSKTPEPWEVSAMGAFAGGTAAALTTPLDVVKTRTMLSAKSDPRYATIAVTFRTIIKSEGLNSLFRGVGPRVMWISIGGGIFLGVYDFALRFLTRQSY
ncbi:mitochondrial carrier [Gonapodya prolifera JEL478]|uniref:Mitochondrial carrier n=1 Tax=Gonapodya prolifera (strain JEL478) TaxID=1344416 RepID=A0A139A2N3_GONPJ|nr:mitochondrial carrier [Gonapodya prolifera JEL478]|eukprot:KXS11046.1 mitochondrial carrier [Gonapodya prolifera JEL478]